MKEHIKQHARKVAREFSYQKLYQRLNHKNIALRDAATYELERRTSIVHIQEKYAEILSEMEPPLNLATLTKNAVMIEVGVVECVMNFYDVPYTYKSWSYNDECIAFSYDCPDTVSEDELKEWLDYIRDEDMIEEEPVRAVLEGKWITIDDIPQEHLIKNSDTYQVSFAQFPSINDG